MVPSGGCGAHILPQVLSGEAPAACSSEADMSQIKTPLSIFPKTLTVVQLPAIPLMSYG